MTYINWSILSALSDGCSPLFWKAITHMWKCEGFNTFWPSPQVYTFGIFFIQSTCCSTDLQTYWLLVRRQPSVPDPDLQLCLLPPMCFGWEGWRIIEPLPCFHLRLDCSVTPNADTYRMNDLLFEEAVMHLQMFFIFWGCKNECIFN